MDELMSDAPVTPAPVSSLLSEESSTPSLMGPPSRPLALLDAELRGGGGNRSRKYNTAADEIQRRLAYGSPQSIHGQSKLGQCWDRTSTTDTVEEEDDNGDWPNYGCVPDLLDEWERFVELIEGSEDWNALQRKVHRLIYLRGLHPVIPSTWKLSFKMWGISQPQLDHVFAPADSDKKVVISNFSPSGEVAAAKALESLFYLSQRIMDYSNQLAFDKMEPIVVKTISNYIKWGLKDALVLHKLMPPLFFVHAYPIDTPGYRMEWSSDEEDESPLKKGAAGEGREHESEMGKHDDDKLASDEETRRFTRWMDRSLHIKMRALGERWRAFLSNPARPNGNQYNIDPPTLFGYAVVQHAVIIVSHDTSKADNPVVVMDKVSLNNRGLWLWNALSLAIPVNVGKMQGSLITAAYRRELLSELGSQENNPIDDPDL